MTRPGHSHYCDIILGAMASQITSLAIVYPIVHLGADQRKQQSSASLAFVREIHWSSVNSAYKWTVTRKMFPLDDVIMPAIISSILSYMVYFMSILQTLWMRYQYINNTQG